MVLEKINKIDKTIARLTKGKKRALIIIINETWDITTDITEMQRITRLLLTRTIISQQTEQATKNGLIPRINR